MLAIHTEVVTPFQQNCRVLVDNSTKDAVLIDPGGEVEYVASFVKSLQVNLRSIVLTHSHIDHCAGVAGWLREHPGLPLYGHEAEADMRARIGEQAIGFGLPADEYENCPEPTEYLGDGDEIEIGSLKATALFTPGHSPGHLSFFFDNVEWKEGDEATTGPLLIAGDALFAGSIGRTDLPGGDHTQLIKSIKTRLLSLPDETVVLCGHGPGTTIGQERESNPFLL